MWLSASAFFHQYYRVYSPATYGQKSDPSGALIRHYCPELAQLPDKFIYEPWKAPNATLAKAGVTLGADYPEVSCRGAWSVRSLKPASQRIIDDKVGKEAAMRKLKAAYAAKIYG